MALGSRESRRALALDVRTLVWQEKKFDAEKFIRTGELVVYRTPAVPDTPQMREALEKAYEEKRRLFGGDQHGEQS